MKQKHTVLIGVVLVALGVYLLLTEYGLVFKLRASWPAILLITGAAMVAAYIIPGLSRRHLLSGWIVLWLGAFFLVSENYVRGYFDMQALWPGIVVAVGLGHVSAGSIERSYRYALARGVFLAGLGGLLFFVNFGMLKSDFIFEPVGVLALFFILMGLWLVVGAFFYRRDEG